MSKAPWAPIRFATPHVERESIAGGGFLLRSSQPLAGFPNNLSLMLDHWAKIEPERCFLCERTVDNAWRQLSYGKAAQSVRAIAQSLIDRNLETDRPVAILSDNGIDNALLQLGAMHVGIPALPISPAYSLMSSDYGKLKHIIAQTQPALVYVKQKAPFAAALESIASNAHELVVSEDPGSSDTAFASLMLAPESIELEKRAAQVGPDTIAKILFTSGSTGLPKGVINTQRMLCSNQQAISQLWPFLKERPPVLVDWLPWNHTFGGNHNFNMMLFHGGTIYIDHGKPVPNLIGNTVQNLREIAPTLYFNVPKGFNDLLPYLESDAELRDRFFSNLDAIFYAGAALPQNLWDRLEAVSTEARGERVPLISAWGATETAPVVTSVHFTIEQAGVIGLPAPGCEIKLVPSGQQLEMRVRGPNVTPGYWRDPAQTAEAFDDEGFYCIGDAGRFADEDDPSKGIIFDGRVAEDFKLNSGTWVHVGGLRVATISAAAPIIQDAVVTGHDGDELGLLIFPNLPACQALADLPDGTSEHDILSHTAVLEQLHQGLLAHNLAHPGSSTTIRRALLMIAPPHVDANEITDKGYINQRAVLEHRKGLIELMYSHPRDPQDLLILTEPARTL